MNQVILNKDASTWPRIKKYWEDMGVQIPHYLNENGACTRTFVVGNNESVYLGAINDTFAAWNLMEVQAANAEIIELPEEKEEKKYPRVMWVWDNWETTVFKRVVLRSNPRRDSRMEGRKC